MTHRQIEREIVHAQLRLMSTDDEAVADATRYLTRALMGCFELQSKKQEPDRLVERLLAGEGEGA